MRKPRDYDSELRALSDKAKQLKERKLQQLGELVIATGADALPVEQLAGALLMAAENSDSAAREAWRERGAAFFRGAARSATGRVARQPAGGAASVGRAQSPAGEAGTR